MNFDIIERAGLTQQEFADLIQFSRPSVNLWINGRKEPGPRAASRITVGLRELHKAVKEKNLPTSNRVIRGRLLHSIRAGIENRTHS